MKIRTIFPLAVLIVSTVTLTAQETQPPTQVQPAPNGRQRPAKRPQAFKKMQADLDQAISRAKLSEDQKRDLDAARATLRDQAERRRSGETPDRDAIRSSMETLRSVISSDAFAPEDREILQKDLQQMKQGSRRAGKRGQKRFGD